MTNRKLTFALCLAMTLAASLRAQVLPSDTIVAGKTIGEWSAEWLKWMVVIPTNHNPMLDTNGSFAGVVQPDGDVFFLGFVPGLTPGTVTRRFDVPEGKYLFFPLIFYEADDVNRVPFTVTELRDQAAGIIDDPVELHAGIDGVEVPNLLQHRAISPVLSFFYESADNFETFAFGQPVTGLIDPVVCDGYWLMVEPLSPGVHTLNFGGTFRNDPFVPADIIDYITVVPVPLTQRADDLISDVLSATPSINRSQPLVATLQAAKASFASENWKTGINQLQAFQQKVRAQVGRNDQTFGDELIQAAQQIIDRATRELP